MRCLRWSLLVALLWSTSLLTSGCDGGGGDDDDDVVVGNGNVTSEEREMSSFDRVDVSSGITSEFQVDASVSEPIVVTVTADENLLSHIETEVTDGTLEARVVGSITSDNQLEVEAMVLPLVGAWVHDGAALVLYDVGAESFELAASNAGNAYVVGEVSTLAVEVANGSDIRAADLASGTATVDVRDGSYLEVCASDQVTGSATDGSTVHVHCGASVDIEADASSTVEQH